MKYLLVTLTAVSLVACGSSGSGTQGPTIAGFTVSPNSLPAGGGSVTLTWNVSGATSLSIDNGIGTVTPTTAGNTTANVTTTTTFTLTATGTSGGITGAPTTKTATTTVTVAAPTNTAPVINTFTISPPTLPAGGGSVTFSWNVTNATTVSIDGNSVTPLTSGNIDATATQSYVTRLSATNAFGTTWANATVTVGGDDAPEFVGNYTGTWAFVVNQVIQDPPGSNVLTSMDITSPSPNALVVAIEFDATGTWTSFGCTGESTTTAAPNLITGSTAAGIVCQVVGDATCGDYTLTANGAFETGYFDNLLPNDPLVIIQTFTTSGSGTTTCNGVQLSLAFISG